MQNSANNIGIGTSNPGQKLDVVGNANISGNVTAAGYFHSSDATLKRNIQTASGLSTIEKLRGVTFTWKESGEKAAGVIAQEVEKVLPEAVQTDKQGLKSVDYDQLIAPLIEAVKEQQKIIEQQDTRIKRLESLVK